MSINFTKLKKNFTSQINKSFNLNLDANNLNFVYESPEEDLTSDMHLHGKIKFITVLETLNFTKVILAQVDNDYYLIINDDKKYHESEIIYSHENRWPFFFLTFQSKEYSFNPNIKKTPEKVINCFVEEKNGFYCYLSMFFEKSSIYNFQVLKLKQNIVDPNNLSADKEKETNELFRILSLLEVETDEVEFSFEEHIQNSYKEIVMKDYKLIRYENIYNAIVFRKSKNKIEEYLNLYKLIENLYALCYVSTFKHQLALKNMKIKDLFSFISSEMNWKHNEEPALMKLIESVDLSIICSKYCEFDNSIEGNKSLHKQIYSLRNHIVHLSCLRVEEVDVKEELKSNKYFELLLFLIQKLYETYDISI